MTLISKKVEVYGIPGFETIGYDDWYSQCENEFKEKLIKQVRYVSLKIINSTDTMIMFKTIEHIETIDNTKSATGIKIIITLESDHESDHESDDNANKQWRVTQERILSDDELEHDKKHGLN